MLNDLPFQNFFLGQLLKLVLLSVLFVGCSEKGTKPEDPSIIDVSLLAELETKYNTYLELYPQVQDASGFIESDHCDALLFTALLGSVSDTGIDMHAAEISPGKWTRRPLLNGIDTCYPENSKSSISRDMLLGLMWWAWQTKNLSVAEDLWEYGQSHSWIMGEGDISRTFFTPNSQATLAELIYRLGGEDHYITRAIPVTLTETDGYQRHLTMLTILLRAEMIGRISDFNLVREAYKSQPRNALVGFLRAKYSNVTYDETIKLLLNTELFPLDRLPTVQDRLDPWLWNRDDGKDWLPGEGDHVHSGGDFLFIAHLILKTFSIN